MYKEKKNNYKDHIACYSTFINRVFKAIITLNFFHLKVRGQDYAIDLCGTLDILQPVISLMLRTQAVNLPPWKIVTWFTRLKEVLKKIEVNLKEVQAGSKPSKELLPKLSLHLEELTSSEVDDEDVGEVDDDDHIKGTFQVQ